MADEDDDERDDEPEDEDGAGDEDEPRPRHRPWLWALTSTVVLLVGVVLLAAYPMERRRADHYREAPVCDRPPVTAEGEPDCVHEVQGVVERTRMPFRRRHRDRYVDFRLAEPTLRPSPSGTVEVDGDSEVFRAMEPGTPAAFGMWGRQVARITVAGVGTVETVESPLAHQAKAAGVGLVGVPTGVAGLWAARRFRRKSGSWWRKAAITRARGVQWGVVPFFGGLGFAFGVLFTLSGGEYEVGALLGAGVFVGVLGGFLGLVLYRWKRRRD